MRKIQENSFSTLKCGPAPEAQNAQAIVYVIQEIPGTKEGRPKINIMGAAQYGKVSFLLPELSQIIFSPGPLVFKLRQGLKNFSKDDYLLLIAYIKTRDNLHDKWLKENYAYLHKHATQINKLKKGKIDD